MIDDFKEGTWGSSFKLYFKGQFWTEVEWSLNGLYNAHNAAIAALSAGIAINPKNPLSIDLTALKAFEGVKRRQEKLFENNDLVVYEDFAHHPSAISGVLESKRSIFQNMKSSLVLNQEVILQRASLFQSEFTEALSKADAVLIGAINKKKGASNTGYLDRLKMVQEIQGLRGNCIAEFFEENDQLHLYLDQFLKDREQRKPAVVVFFTNGSF